MNRAAARLAFLTVPASQRRYALGDMDSKDGPLRVLVAGPGGQTYLPSTRRSHKRPTTGPSRTSRSGPTGGPIASPRLSGRAGSSARSRHPPLPLLSEQAGARPRPTRPAQ
ncbi:DUF7639 domain-containing protein [Streptomyces graminofaciens]|uniref:DUF7639 domain-containing protein n=1 Tax=Streptomyces graminofaciens TaxID=68212 RepID=UPI003D9AD815